MVFMCLTTKWTKKTNLKLKKTKIILNQIFILYNIVHWGTEVKATQEPVKPLILKTRISKKIIYKNLKITLLKEKPKGVNIIKIGKIKKIFLSL